MDKIKGELIDFRVRGGDFWGTGVVRAQHDGGDVTVVGKMLGASVGDTVELEGSWSDHPKYGRQFKLQSCQVVLPADTAGVVGWLSSKLPQISRRRAERLVEQYGVEGLWRVLDAADVNALCAVEGITPRRADEIVAAYQAHRAERDRLVRFKQWGLTDGQLARVIAEWGDDAEERLTQNPYDLIECVPLFGWMRADQVAMRMGIARNAPPRLAAGLMHAMGEASASGHVYVAQGKLVALVAKKVCGVDEGLVRDALDGLLVRGRLFQLAQNIYLPKLAKAEGRLAKVFAQRTRAGRVA